MLLSYMNRFKMTEVLSDWRELERLTRFDAFGSWAETTAFLRKVASAIFAFRERMQANRGLEIVGRVEAYVHRNLQGDLSLSQLGRTVY